MAKYGSLETRLKRLQHKRGASNTWQGVTKIITILTKGYRCLVKKGAQTRFWTEKWLLDEMVNFEVSTKDNEKTMAKM